LIGRYIKMNHKYKVSCRFGYKEIKAIHPDNWENHVRTVNAEYDYCKSLSISKWDEFKGKCDEVDLPSFHPYWRVKNMLDDAMVYFEIKAKYEKGIHNEKLIKIHFDQMITRKQIKDILVLKEDSINKLIKLGFKFTALRPIKIRGLFS
jgi:hypothetical protein